MSTNTLNENTASDPSLTDAEQVFQNPDEQLEAVTRYVVVNVNANLYGMATDTTVELMSSTMTMITRVPHSPEFISGVINHRGTIIPVIDARALLGFERRGQDSRQLVGLFSKFKQDHAEWFDALEQTIAGGAPYAPPSDLSVCRLSTWQESVLNGSVERCADELAHPTVNGIVKRMSEPHEKIHNAAGEAIGMAESGDLEKAQQLVASARATGLKELEDIFAEIMHAIDRIYESMLVITEFGGQKAAIAVDGVSFVADCKHSEIEPLPDTADNTEFLSGLVHRPDGSYILIADIENIYAHACVGQ